MSETDPLVGSTVGPCRLEALVGQGASGRVYRARHLAMDRVVALKLMDHARDEARRAAAVVEARAAARLDDPRVVAIYETGEERGRPYLVLQWVEGENLEARVRRLGPLPPSEALAIMRETAMALRSAHAAGLVHCDVKPENILIDARGAVKLADFGVARLAGSAGSAGETAAGSFHFMAPEQGLDSAPDPRWDLYSLGATWYYLLTGRPLFPGRPEDALLRHREEAPPDVRALRPEASERVSALIRRLVAKNPDERPRTADQALQEMTVAEILPDTDGSGSPFRILPPPPEAIVPEASAGASVERVPFIPAPPSPPPPDSSALGSRRTFYALFSILGLAAVGWPWRKAVAEDWLAGAVLFASLPALLTFGRRRSIQRRAAGVLLCLGSAACFWRGARGSAGFPTLETLIATVFGAAASGGAVYLGLWGTDAEEAWWSRVLAPLGGALLAVGGLTWSAGAAASWTGALADAAPRAWRAWWGSGGGWRWGGLIGLAVAAAATRRIKTVSKAPSDRKLNWND